MENNNIDHNAETSEPKKNNNKFFLIVFILIIAAGGFMFWRSEQAKKAAASKRTEMPPMVVKYMTVNRSNVPFILEYTGQTNGFKQADVRAQVSGILMKKEYIEGHPVKAGQVLFRIDPSPYRATLNKSIGSLKQNKVQMNLAEIEYNRVSTLYKKNAVSKTDLDNAEAAFNSSKAAVDAGKAAVRQAQIDLDWTVVRAPISGLSSKEQCSVGNLITANSSGSLLTTIVQSDRVYVDFAIPADEHRKNEMNRTAGFLKTLPEGITVKVALGDGTFYDKKGKIDFQDQFVDAETATIKARAIFDNPGNLLYPGQFVRVYIYGNYLNNIISIPLRATLQTSQGPIVYVLNSDNIPELRKIEIVKTVENNCIVSEGLKEGERIVTDGVGKIVPGKAVKLAGDDDKSLPAKQNQPASTNASSSDAQQN